MRGGSRPTGVKGTTTRTTPATGQPGRPQDARHIPREFKLKNHYLEINF